MNILLLNQQKEKKYLKKIISFINSFRDEKIYILKKLPNIFFLKKKKIDLLISYHNKFIIDKKRLKFLKYNCINFHPSYLPKNRGSHPILFSAAKNDIFGVTIHRVNEKIDAGDYLFQKKLLLSKNLTLKQAYEIHENESFEGFKKIYIKIKKDILEKKSISFKKKRSLNILGNFNYHKPALDFISLLPKKWDTKIYEVREKYLMLKNIVN
jgi:hypothetical protein